MKNFLYFCIAATVLFAVSPLISISQNTFYKQYITAESYLPTKLVQCTNGNYVFAATWDSSSDGLTLFNLNNDGQLNWGLVAENFQLSTIVSGLAATDDNNIALMGIVNNGQYNRYYVIKLDEFGQKKWDIILSDINFFQFSNNFNLLNTTSDGGLVAGYSTLQSIFITNSSRAECSKISSTGEVLWTKRYDMGESEVLIDIMTTSSDNILIATEISEPTKISNLIYTDPTGEPIWTKSFNNFFTFRIAAFPNGDLLISGKIDEYSILLRMDEQGVPIWAKRLNLPSANSHIFPSITPVGKVICGYFDTYFLLDGNGNLEWAWENGGLPIAAQDGGYALLSGYFDSGGKVISTLKKTDENGLVDSCESRIPCLMFEDVIINVVPGAVYSTSDLSVDTTIELSLMPTNVIVEDYCQPFTEEPSAVFSAPSSICEGDCFLLSDLQQPEADTWAWNFSGLTPTNSNLQNPGEICATTPGVYEIKQVIAFGGCIDSFSLTIEVVPPAQPNLGNDTLVCMGESLQLDATTAGADTYIWNDQTNSPIKQISKSGTYAVTVANGECEGTDSIELRFFEELFSSNNFDLGPSILQCEGTVVSLSPNVPAGLLYEWADGIAGSNREISMTGQYELIGSLEGCSISGFIEITFEKCEPKIYVPNAFSPNDDGINDFFEIYGEGFEILHLKIFNRWGGLVFDGTDNDAKWSGSIKGKKAQAGVYVYLLEYMDSFSNELKMETGNVILLK